MKLKFFFFILSLLLVAVWGVLEGVSRTFS